MRAFGRHSWPGNVRELENMVRRMVVLGNEEPPLEELNTRAYDATPKSSVVGNGGEMESVEIEFDEEGGIDLKAVSRRAAQVAEKRVIERVLQQTRWNRKQAAGRLKISYKALLYKMKENGLSQGG